MEKDGKGKVYEDLFNILIFEGEYLNGKKNGQGKEYGINEIVIFEGEYLNGKRNGKGKEKLEKINIKKEEGEEADSDDDDLNGWCYRKF